MELCICIGKVLGSHIVSGIVAKVYVVLLMHTRQISGTYFELAMIYSFQNLSN
jgi:hypothetical protein